MNNNPTPSSAAAGYDAEVRFGVVMYGGVSLAIYINGVTNELNELARATPRGGLVAADAGSTRGVYAKLSRLVNDPPLVERYAQFLAGAGGAPDPLAAPPRDQGVATRFVVDVIAGTSAGGINGLFLAKALANDEPFAPLADLWIREGDIAGLLNDRVSYRDPDMRGLADRSAAPVSLLNSDRMYRKLRVALKAMSDRAPTPAAPSPWVDELDLYVTTTDIRGSDVTLRLFDKVVHEKRHRQVFHFRYTDDGAAVVGNDLSAPNEPFLAFAARCTSSFPFAFEPMTLDALPRLDASLDETALLRWNGFFDGLPPAEVDAGHHRSRAFGDGGYLDNKPFSYAVATLSRRAASVPIERKLVYVEPAPEHIGDEPVPTLPPDALTNALDALTTIPRYETIREDLEAVLKRNRRIERIDRIVRLGERDLDNATEDPMARIVTGNDGRIPDWHSRTMEDMRRYYGDAFLPYSRLRQYTVTDDIADRLATLWTLERDSDQVYALRALVRAWREDHYSDTGDIARGGATTNAFLADFDLAYRTRRAAFLLRRIDQLLRLVVRRRRGPLEALSEADVALVGRLERRAGLNLRDPSLGDGTMIRAIGDDVLAPALAALSRLKLDLAAAYTALRNAPDVPRDDDALAARRSTVRPELIGVLGLVLGHASPGPALLRTAGGAEVPVQFDDEVQKLPSATRTLQEAVFLRAQALLRLAREHRGTLLQDLLEEDIGRVRAMQSALIDGTDAAPGPGRRIWQRLGQPKLVAVPAGDKFAVQIAVDERTGVAELDTAPAYALRRFLGELYLRFDTYDQMSFPLYYDTDSGEPATVEVVRISPEDAPALIDETTDPRRKLAGTALANFGAFLQRHWRTNDIMWGRLDGAERLIAALLPARDAATSAVRTALTGEAHRAILREALLPEGHRQLTGLMCDALAEVDASLPKTTAATARSAALTAALVDRLAPGTPASRRRLEQIAAALLEDDALVRWVRESRDVDRTPDPDAMLDNAARAVTITGRLLETTVRERGVDLPAVRWVARIGLAAQGLLAVSLPGSLRSRWWTHGLKVLYAFELVMLLVGFGLGSEPVRTAAVTALGITATLHLASLLLSDVLASRRSWKAKSAWLGGVPVVVLAALGVLALARVGWKALLGLG